MWNSVVPEGRSAARGTYRSFAVTCQLLCPFALVVLLLLKLLFLVVFHFFGGITVCRAWHRWLVVDREDALGKDNGGCEGGGKTTGGDDQDESRQYADIVV